MVSLRAVFWVTFIWVAFYLLCFCYLWDKWFADITFIFEDNTHSYPLTIIWLKMCNPFPANFNLIPVFNKEEVIHFICRSGKGYPCFYLPQTGLLQCFLFWYQQMKYSQWPHHTSPRCHSLVTWLTDFCWPRPLSIFILFYCRGPFYVHYNYFS